MSRERHARLRDAFARALPLEGEERRSALDESCAGDEDLRREAEELLARTERPSPLLDAASPGIAGREHAERALLAAGALPLPEEIGGHRILRVLGEGASSIVYEAEQERPRRRIALKVLRAALSSSASVRRFEREAAILARLQHPGIATIHDAGLAQLGGPSSPPQPYFAMELVQGLPITGHADAAGLEARGRLALVADVCDAVEHAHSRGVVHRDLKPANVLVDETGRPKVLDFGVARTLDPDLASPTLRTATGQVVGTLPYMSPEQVAGRPDAVGVRSDVYSLGVIAFELLAGRLPHDVEGLGLAEATRVIREDDAERVGSIDGRLRGDVETIVAKALEKDSERRYESAAALASDIRRWLAGDPIAARPASAAYQVGRFARRHRALVGAIAGTFVALLAGMTVATWQAVKARRSEAVAVRQAYRASLAAAAAALDEDDSSQARRHLESAPVALRGWEWRYLDSQLDTSRARWKGPRGRPIALGVSPDGRLAESVRRVGEGWSPAPAIDGWRIDSAEPARAIGAGGAARPLRTSLPTPWIVAMSAIFQPGEREVEVRREDGSLVATLRPCDLGEPSIISALAADGGTALLVARFEASSGDEVPAMACDLSTGIPRGPRMEMPRLPNALSSDGTLLAVTDGRGSVRVLDVSTGLERHAFSGPLDYMSIEAFSPDGNFLLTGSQVGVLRCWDVRSGESVGVLHPDRMGGVWDAAWSPDGTLVAVAGADGEVRLVAPDLSRQVAVLHGHRASVNEIAFVGTGEGLRLLSLDIEGNLLEWDPESRQAPIVLRGHDSYVNPVAFTPDGSRLHSGGWDGRVNEWDAGTWTLAKTFVMDEPSFVTDLAVVGNGTRLVVGSPSKDVRLIDAASGAVLARRVLRDRGPGLAWSGGRIAIGFDGPEPVELLDETTLETRERLPLRGAPRAWSPDGSLLAIATGESLALVDVRSAAAEVVRELPAGFVTAAAFDPAGSILVTGTREGGISAWRMSDGRELARLPDSARGVSTIAWSPDGARMASGDLSGIIRLWDPRTWTDVLELRGHEGYVYSLAWSPDGSTLASGSGDATIRVRTAPPPG